MPLNVGGTGYGTVPGAGTSSSAGASESSPLISPEIEPEHGHQWDPLTMEELEVAAGGPGWRRIRCYMVVLFWLAWISMLATSVAIIVTSPRPVVTPLTWWQKTLFYQLQPDLVTEKQAEESGGFNGLCDQLPYFRSLGIGALILQGLFDKELSPLNITVTGEKLRTYIAQLQHLLAECNKIGIKVVLDICELETGNSESSHHSTLHALVFWLEQGVAGFAICDTDAAYSEKILLEWRGLFKEFSRQEEERILVLKQTRQVHSLLTNSTLVDVLMKSILPSSSHQLSANEVADAIETHLQTREDMWTSWTVGGKPSHDLKKLLLVLMMTLPGSPVLQYDDEIDLKQNVYVSSTHGGRNETATPTDKEETKPSALALFSSLSQSRSREEALLFGNFTFLPFNSSSNSTLAPPSSPPVLAFLRSWGCVSFLILLNVGAEHHTLDPAWAPSLPEAGVFMVSTGMDRLGSTTLNGLQLRPHEAVIIKLLEAGSYS